MPRALTVAGSDSGGGAGIQTDLKTFLAARTYGMSVITALTAQNTLGVAGVHVVPAEFVALQFDAVVDDIGVDAVKTGMLVNAEIIATVADRVRRHGIRNLVVDPVMIAKSGDPLLADDARAALVEELLPLALIATPNLHEASVIAGMTIQTLDQMAEAARALHELGVRYPLVKGGHLAGDEAVDVLYDGREFSYLREPRIATQSTHGTGCTLSAAICAALARGFDPIAAVRFGKRFITEALASALPIGRGHGPTNPGGLVVADAGPDDAGGPTGTSAGPSRG
ncbi:MAG TPA: bifunctional hydroxymethylpyrimidine kinase/phosphomethylpyrimidine kinase [Bacillota bacterium]